MMTHIIINTIVMVTMNLYCHCINEGLTRINISIIVMVTLHLYCCCHDDGGGGGGGGSSCVYKQKILIVNTSFACNAHNVRRSVCRLTPVKFAERYLLLKTILKNKRMTMKRGLERLT